MELSKNTFQVLTKDETINITKNCDILFDVNCSKLTLNINVEKNVEASVMLVNEKAKAVQINVNLKEGAIFSNNYMDLTNDNVDAIFNQNLDQKDAKLNNYFLTYSRSKQTKNVLINSVNNSTNTEIDTKSYSLCMDDSKTNVVCKATVNKKAFDSVSTQLLRAIMFGEKSRAIVDPYLIIHEPNIRSAGHGATVGQVDEEHIYYLQSRGLTKQKAKTLIVTGYFNPLFELITNQDIIKRINKVVEGNV